jgi:hypothetical protein
LRGRHSPACRKTFDEPHLLTAGAAGQRSRPTEPLGGGGSRVDGLLAPSAAVPIVPHAAPGCGHELLGARAGQDVQAILCSRLKSLRCTHPVRHATADARETCSTVAKSHKHLTPRPHDTRYRPPSCCSPRGARCGRCTCCQMLSPRRCSDWVQTSVSPLTLGGSRIALGASAAIAPSSTLQLPRCRLHDSNRASDAVIEGSCSIVDPCAGIVTEHRAGL